jgi:hypothetical protein
MKAKRIVFKKDERVEIYVRRTETPATCLDGKLSGIRANMVLIGPVTLAMVVAKKRKTRE